MLAFAKALEPEADLEDGLDLKKRYELPKPKPEGEGAKGKDAKPGDAKAGAKGAAKPAGAQPGEAEVEKPDAAAGGPKADPTPQVIPEAPARTAPEAAAQAEPAPAVAAAADRPPTAPGAPAQPAEPAAEDAAADPAPAAAAAPAEPAEVAAPEPDPAAAFFGGGQRQREPAKLTWEEQKTWKDGDRNTVEVGTGVYYLTREVHARRAGIAELQLDGPAGVKVWLNGELVFEDAPAPPAPEAPEDAEPDEFDFGAFMRQSTSGPDRVARLGFREGVNELVVKAVFRKSERPSRRRSFGGGGGGGDRKPTGTVAFDFEAEGEDVLTYEVLTALRATAPQPAPATASDDRPSATTEPAAAVRKPAAGTGKAGVVSGASGTPGSEDDDQAATTEPGTDALFAPTAGELGADARTLLGVKAIQPAPQRYELEPDARHAAVLREHYRRNVSTIGRALSEELARLEGERRELIADIPETLVMSEREQRRDNYVFLFGDYRQRGDDVPVDTPASLPAMAPELPKNRLGLAKWLTSGTHPLTGRVTMNRMWQSFFGTGIASTPEDFGVRSELPEHGPLLDWLAVEFVESGWDWQHMQRLVVLSATYRQTASAAPEAYAADPANLLLARGPRLRLSAEGVRDNALFVSGLLNEEVGGPSVKPYQAPGVWSEVFGGSSWRKSKGEDQYRRGLYTYWKRRAPYPSMATFDAQKGEVCTVKRPATNTPLQALVLLNNPVYVEAARAFAQRTLGEQVTAVEPELPAPSAPATPSATGEPEAPAAPTVPPAPSVSATDRARLVAAFRRCTSRPPTAAELDVLAGLLAEQRTHYEADAEAAAKLLKIGDAPLPEDHDEADAPELAAWTAVMSALLNLDATIHRG